MSEAASRPPLLNAFCVDLEEWFHICAVDTPYADPSTWDRAPSCVERDTESLLELLDEAGARSTFLCLGWIAETYPALIRRIADRGHEIGAHSYHHRLVFEMTPEQFRRDLVDCRRRLEDAGGRPVTSYRAPSFSIRSDSFWAFPILAEEGFTVDSSIVPAARGSGGVPGFPRRPFRLRTGSGPLTMAPLSVMRILGREVQFSGGGYLRLFPRWLIEAGFRRCHDEGLPVISYIHPREVNPDQPRLDLPAMRRFRYYVGLRGCTAKLRYLLSRYRFGTLTEALAQLEPLAERRLRDGRIESV